jgi:hypothetical protein
MYLMSDIILSLKKFKLLVIPMNKKLKLAIPLLLSLLAMSSLALGDAITVQTQVSKSMSAVFNYTAVSFGILSAGSNDTAAPSLGNTSIDVTTNYAYKMAGSVASSFSDGSGHTFNQNNLKVYANESVDNLVVGSAVAMTSGTATIVDLVPYTVTPLYVGHWLSIPAGQYAGSYSTSMTATVTND